MALLEEIETGGAMVVQQVEATVSVLCVDCSDSICPWLREYDPVTDSTEEICTFSALHPNSLPNVEAALQEIFVWAEAAAGRANFYSAREGPVEAPPKRKPPWRRESLQQP